MGAVLAEAWLWLLVAFILGVVVGYYLRRYTAVAVATGDGAEGAEVVASDAEADHEAEDEADETAETSDMATDAVADVEDEPEESEGEVVVSADAPDSEAAADEETTDEAPVEEARPEVDAAPVEQPEEDLATLAALAQAEAEAAAQERAAAPDEEPREPAEVRPDVDIDTLDSAVSTFAHLSKSSKTAPEAAPAPESGDPAPTETAEEDLVDQGDEGDEVTAGGTPLSARGRARLARLRRGTTPTETGAPTPSARADVDTSGVFLPEASEPLRVPHGRKAAEAARSAQSAPEIAENPGATDIDTEADDKDEK